MSTIYCPQDTTSLLLLAALLTFNNVIASFKSGMLLQSNHQCCHFSAIRLNTSIFLDRPIREILSLCFLPNRTKVSLFCYSAWYQYPSTLLTGQCPSVQISTTSPKRVQVTFTSGGLRPPAGFIVYYHYHDIIYMLVGRRLVAP